MRIALPTLGIDAPLVNLGITADGHVQVPSEPDAAGWLTTGPAPGQQGPAVVLGHVDSTTGPAVFYPLRRLAVGDPVVVTRRDGSRVTFTVDGLRTFAKADFPTQATYGPVPGPALRLITCDGPYDRSAGGYQDNLVVFAS
jgi:sortase (surface protein transpeptidase)